MTTPPARTRVLLLDLGAHYGGVENYLVNLAALIGAEVDLYALCVLPELAARLRSVGVTVVRIPECPGILKPMRFLLATPVLLWMILRYKIHSVQLNGLLESALILPTRFLGRKAVYTRHGPFELEYYSPLRQPHKYLPRWIARACVRIASHTVCVSQAVSESVRPLLPRQRFSVIPNWVSSHLPGRMQRREEEIAEILCLSRLEHYKGIHLLLEATRPMQNIRVTIAGDGSYRHALEAQAVGRTNVRFLGFVRDTDSLYAQADIVVVPSMGPEGLPMSSLEAMARGIPCIFSDLPVHREISDDGTGARLFRSGSIEDLRTVLEELLRSQEAQRAVAQEAYRIIQSRYTDVCVRSAYVSVFAAAGGTR